jgi:hypothetical protein
VPESVEEWADDRSEQGKRCHGDQQVQSDTIACLIGRHAEEDRAGKAHRDQGVAGARGRVQVEQAHHANFAGAALHSNRTDIPGNPSPHSRAAARRYTGTFDRGAHGSTRAAHYRHAHHPVASMRHRAPGVLAILLVLTVTARRAGRAMCRCGCR